MDDVVMDLETFSESMRRAGNMTLQHMTADAAQQITRLRQQLNAASVAQVQLMEVLELDDDMDWDDVVYYAAKAKSSLRMTNESVRRRTAKLELALGLPYGAGWIAALNEAKRLYEDSGGE